jgi:DNA gyrase/topoisomerase IV, subunit A
MGDRSGVGLVECTILEALDSLGAQPRRHRRSAKVLEGVEERIGLAPGYAYEVLLDLARPWTMPLLLVDGQGNFGTRGNDPAANYRYTEAGLSRAGQVVLAAERGDLAPVPVGLVNGNVYREGLRPPFRPLAIIEALREVIQRPRVTGKDLTSIVGPPCFLNRCTVTGDFAAMAAGRPTTLRLEARVTVSADQRHVLIENFPPNANPDEVAHTLAGRATMRAWAAEHPGLYGRTHLPLREIRDESSERHGDLLICVPSPGTTAGELCEQLMNVYGVYTTVRVDLPRSLPAMLRNWVKAHADEDLRTSLAALENAVRSQAARS